MHRWIKGDLGRYYRPRKAAKTPTIKPIEVCQWATRQPIPGVAVSVDLDPRYARSQLDRLEAAHRAAEAQAKWLLREVPTCPHGGEVAIFTTHAAGTITAYLQCEPCQDVIDGAGGADGANGADE